MNYEEKQRKIQNKKVFYNGIKQHGINFDADVCQKDKVNLRHNKTAKTAKRENKRNKLERQREHMDQVFAALVRKQKKDEVLIRINKMWARPKHRHETVVKNGKKLRVPISYEKFKFRKLAEAGF